MNLPVSHNQLRSIVERVERLHEDAKAISDDTKEVYAEAKANGFDTKAIRQIVKERAQDTDTLLEREAVLDLYRSALGMPLAHAGVAGEVES